jgi:hypothetical protein
MDNGMKCVLVGNGTSAIEKPLGSFIDSCDEVVRFNSFETKGYEEFVGTKTTTWFLVRLYLPTSFRMSIDYNDVYLHSWTWNKDKCSLWKNMGDKFPSSNVTKTEESVIIEMQEFLGSNYYGFSTGAIAAWIMLKRFDKIHLHGFDWWERDEHHWSDNDPRGILHKPNIELDFFKKLGERIVFL